HRHVARHERVRRDHRLAGEDFLCAVRALVRARKNGVEAVAQAFACRRARRQRALLTKSGERSPFPSPLWGGVRGGGKRKRWRCGVPPSPTLPHKGGGSA